MTSTNLPTTETSVCKEQDSLEHMLVCQNWLESEQGWGTRPDGVSLHLNDEHREKFIKNYWDSMPDETPEEYSRPEGYPKIVRVTDALYTEVSENTKMSEEREKCGLRCYSVLKYETLKGTALGTDEDEKQYKKIEKGRWV